MDTSVQSAASNPGQTAMSQALPGPASESWKGFTGIEPPRTWRTAWNAFGLINKHHTGRFVSMIFGVSLEGLLAAESTDMT